MNPNSFTPPDLDSMGRLLPAFEFKVLVASNHVSAVYMANQRSLERDVAIKVLAPQVGRKEDFKQSFETTARMMGKLHHPNLIGIYDSGMADGMLYFVMEFVPGKSLARSSKGRCVEVSQALRLVTGIAAGLAHAHEHGIIHGNLNPCDILLNQKAEPKIGNFGIPHADAGETTPQSADPPKSVAADIHAAGAILYELLTGRPHNAGAPPPSTLSKCGPAIDAIWAQATNQDPARRFPNAQSLVSALEEASQKGRATLTPKAAAPPVSEKSSAKPASPPKSAPPDPDESPAPPRRSHVGFNWKLVFNLIIIGVLLYAISLAWKNYQKKTAERDREHLQALAEQEAEKERKREEAAKRAEERRNLANTPDTKPPVVPDAPPPKIESPAESLARLRNDLYSGDRGEMPVGSIRQGDSDYFLITDPMTWPEASWFAEKHGAHLAIPNEVADLTWLQRKVAPDEVGIWIGAGRSGRSEWTLADGSPWKPAKDPAGLGAFLALDKNGILRAEGQKRSLPFVLQWHRNGKNPGSLDSLLEITRKSLDGSAPVFPPGTGIIGNRRYLYIARPATWRDAYDLANTSGGHLVVASETAEITYLEEFTQDISAENGIWLGAFMKGTEWVWQTGEPWKSAKWTATPVAEEGHAVILMPGEGWNSQTIDNHASGFIIEWSNDRKGGSSASGIPTVDAPASGLPEFDALKKRALDLITTADTKRTEQLASNAKTFLWDLDVWLRGLPRSENSTWTPYVTLLKATVANNRVPSTIPLTSGIKLSPNMAKIASGCAERQDRIDAEFLAEVDRVRTAYTVKVREYLAQALKSGKSGDAKTLSEALDAAATTANWVTSFGFDPKPKNPVPVADNIRENTD
jgi:serine/threonine protein kinase